LKIPVEQFVREMKILKENTFVILGLCALDSIKIKTHMDLEDLIMSGLLKGRAIVECTLLPDARNQVLRISEESFPNFTHILFVDSDQCGFQTPHLKAMLEADKDIIAGITRQRAGEHKMTFNPFKNELLGSEVVEVQHTGMFFTLVKREVFDVVREDTNKGPRWFRFGQQPRNLWPRQKKAYIARKWKEFSQLDNGENPKVFTEIMEEAFDMGLNATLGNSGCGEDVNFCYKAREAGFKVWVHSGIRLGHIGEEVFYPQGV
jgi:hypothetical protein